jgi:hypothetical protein
VRSQLVLVAALGGCNWLYGLGDTQLIEPVDAQYFDAPADAPWACPSSITEEPKFRPRYGQIEDAQDCDDYMFADDGFAVAHCYGRGGIMQARTGELLTPAPALVNMPGVHYNPRLSIDGQRLLVRNSSTSKVDVFARQPDDTWLPTGHVFDDNIMWITSNATRGPDRRVVQWLYNGSNGYEMRELVEQPDASWQVVATYAAPLVYPGSNQPMSLSGDGLRLVSLVIYNNNVGVAAMMRRASLNDPFASFTPLTTVPTGTAIRSPFMTDDCGQYYFSALGTVFYQQQ